MFDRGRFDRMGFNVAPRTDGTIYYAVTMAETVHAAVTNGAVYYETAHMTEQVKGSWMLAQARFMSLALSEAVGGRFAVQVNVYAGAEMTETVGAAAYMTLETWLSCDMAEAVRAAAYLGYNQYIAPALQETVHSLAYLSHDTYISGILFYDVWYAAVTTRTFEYERAVIDIDIPSGSELIIDAGTYNMLLDGENVIWAHEGAWLDRLDRDVFSVGFRPGSGALAADVRILYDERWL